ncbi:hypothetical protein [Bizionia myxarmorum]|uniref:Alpha/beta hydrolase n=1 Tax=Bizionia myxarmorum TaxID=291186 RepID=A0A5D0QU11_9FLAO|nr:hypothetical protein [Bizionia myxarmorum]TYB72572.1 hypothetical protein ES674_15300 [Bizionia myxarmorum]
MRILTNILILLISVSVFGQTTREIKLNETLLKNLEKNTIDITDKTYLYINDGNSNELFYYALKPKGKIKGTLILLPPTAQNIEDVINNNITLSELAFEKGILLIIPSINYNLYLDEITMTFLNTTFKKAISKYQAPKDQIIIGGFSLGGMNAIRYVEISKENPDLTTIEPIAVYGIDPPLDWTRIYYSFQRTKDLNFSEPAVNEAKDYLAKLNEQFGGSPDNVPNIYIKHSMYSKTVKNGGNSKFLIDVPIRIYSDPDIDWHLKERQTDFYDINALDQTAMINQLSILGNENAEFINALGKGYRLNGIRHPHSWSIAEPNELMEWIIDKLE